MCDDKSVKSCKCNKRFNDSIGHEIKVLNQVLQRKLIYSAKDKGVDKLTLMHGWIIAYLYDHRDEDVYQKDIENAFSIARSTVTSILKLMALVYDLKKTKDFGYNMVRKHVKVEPARWYTHCDQLGLIVWQDMPNGGPSPQWQARNYFNGREVIRSAASEANYRKEWKEIIDCLYSYPSIAVWVPFNEAWGQFKTPEIVAWTKEYDPSRLVNPASGGNHYTCGDILDLHHYPGPNMFLYDPRRATVLGEYGGIGLVIEGNTWVNDKKNWGYVKFNTSDEVTNEYIKYGKHLLELIQKGFSAAVYTQTTDVEGEINGLMTYDRKVIKMNEAKVREINQQICNSLNK